MNGESGDGSFRRPCSFSASSYSISSEDTFSLSLWVLLDSLSY